MTSQTQQDRDGLTRSLARSTTNVEEIQDRLDVAKSAPNDERDILFISYLEKELDRAKSERDQAQRELDDFDRETDEAMALRERNRQAAEQSNARLAANQQQPEQETQRSRLGRFIPSGLPTWVSVLIAVIITAVAVGWFVGDNYRIQSPIQNVNFEQMPIIVRDSEGSSPSPSPDETQQNEGDEDASPSPSPCPCCSSRNGESTQADPTGPDLDPIRCSREDT